MVFPLSHRAAAARPVQGLRILMPVNDPNQIDAAKAAALYAYLRDWHKVAKAMKRPNGTPYKTSSIVAAVGRRRRAEARK